MRKEWRKAKVLMSLSLKPFICKMATLILLLMVLLRGLGGCVHLTVLLLYALPSLLGEAGQEESAKPGRVFFGSGSVTCVPLPSAVMCW